MTNNTKRVKLNIPMCVACVLLCLTLVSVHMTSGLYAKYVTSDSSSDTARVAKFQIDVEKSGEVFSTDWVIDCRPGTVEDTIVIKNSSEVAVKGTITVENTTQNIPLTFDVDVNGTSDAEGPAEVLYQLPFTLAANETGTYTLTAIWSEENALEYMGMVDLVGLTVSAEQID